MGRVKDELIDLQFYTFAAFDRGLDLEETIAYVKQRVQYADEVLIEELYQDLKDEF